MKTTLLITAVFSAWCLAQEATPREKIASDRIELTQWFDWEQVSDPKLSPDGGQIVFTRTWMDRLEDRQRTELWLMDADGRRLRQLAAGSQAQWSKDGTRIAYLAEGEPGGTQTFVVWVGTRGNTQVTHSTEAAADLAWSHDGQWIACTMQVPERESYKIDMPKAPKGAKWEEDAKVITRLHYRRDQRGYTPSGFRHLFVVPATGGTPRQVSQGDFNHGAPEWTADDQELVCDGLRRDDADWLPRESEIYAISVATGSVRTLTDRVGPDRGPLIQGEHVWYLGFDDSRATHSIERIHVVPLAGGPARCLTPKFDRSAQNLRASRCVRNSVLFDYEDRGAIRTGRISLDGALEELTPLDAQFRTTGDFDDGRLLGALTNVHEPSAIATHSGGRFEKLTRVHEDVLFGRKLGAVEEIRWKGPGDWEIQGWLVKPPDFDPQKKYPLVLQIHGGPHAMYGVNFDFERQWFAAQGYLLLYCNPRGSTGYGAAFACGIQNAYPDQDYEDLMKGVDAAIALGSVDTDNLFVYGGSGGGVLTLWAVGSTNRFRAAVSMFPVTNWISFVGTTDGSYWYTNFEKLPWEDISEHWRRSPLRLVGNVQTPTMLLTGELDLRTPMAQTEEYYQALKLRKVDTVMVRIQDEFHGAGSRHPSNRLRRMLYVESWFARHKKPS